MPPKGIFRARQQCLALFLASTRTLVHVAVIALAALGAAGCALDVLSSPEEVADRISHQYGWQKLTLPTKSFTLRGYFRASQTNLKQLTVYIEGDGEAWINEFTLAADPTPSRPFVLDLAVRHPRGAVLYLARPCHYVRDTKCHSRYWSTYRFAPEVVAAMDGAIEQIKQQTGASSLVLVGWSGGGVIAALLAARRKDVDEIITLGANLDHAYWTAMDRLTPLDGSLNPADYVQVLQKIPQRHLIGAKDVVVSPQVVRSYVNKMTDTSKTKIIVLEDFDHDCCWAKNWPQLLNRP